jgi:hypothetical protein
MSTLTLLPLMRVTDGVQADEDWRLSIAFYLDDGVTPIPLDGLSFTVTVGDFATVGSADGHIVTGGPSNNVLALTVLAAEKSSWPTGVYAISLSGGDGVYTRDLFASSTLAIGAAQVARIVLLVAPDVGPRAVAAPIPAALAEALQALQPDAIIAALAALEPTQLQVLTQAVFAALPVQTGANAPVASGQAFVNGSGYVVIAQ